MTNKYLLAAAAGLALSACDPEFSGPAADSDIGSTGAEFRAGSQGHGPPDCDEDPTHPSCGAPHGAPDCGDGDVHPSEECDDGNMADGDGCSASCEIEGSYECEGEPSMCHNCGNGVVGPTEECDDKNTVSSDGCDSSCDVESGYLCFDPDSPASAPDLCTTGSGDLDVTWDLVEGDLNASASCPPGGDTATVTTEESHVA